MPPFNQNSIVLYPVIFFFVSFFIWTYFQYSERDFDILSRKISEVEQGFALIRNENQKLKEELDSLKEDNYSKLAEVNSNSKNILELNKQIYYLHSKIEKLENDIKPYLMDIAEISTFDVSSYPPVGHEYYEGEHIIFKAENAWHGTVDKNGYVIAYFPQGKICTVYGVTTRGRGKEYEWVSSYKLEYLDTNHTWIKIGEFVGNKDVTSLKRNDFTHPVVGIGLKLTVLSFQSVPTMKLAIHGYCE